jgi:P pilus assembly chaperone PapD
MLNKYTNITLPKRRFMASAKAVACLFILSLMLISSSVAAQGNLLITPRRVVFEGNKSSQEINLANTGQDSATYSVSFVQYRMTPEGSFEQIEEPDPGQMFADKIIRYFPRQVTLAPGEAQMVRMQLRRSNDMTPGEYRSHMYFRAVPKEGALGIDEPLEDTTAIGIRLTPIFGITIPVIVRVGDTEATVTIDNMQLDPVNDSTAMLSLTLNRNGNKSVYGDLTVDYQPPKGASMQVGLVRGIAVYTPNDMRRFQLELKKPEGVNYDEGKLVIRYADAEEGKEKLLAEKELMLK